MKKMFKKNLNKVKFKPQSFHFNLSITESSKKIDFAVSILRKGNVCFPWFISEVGGEVAARAGCPKAISWSHSIQNTLRKKINKVLIANTTLYASNNLG